MDRQNEEFETFLRQFQLRTPAPLPEVTSVRDLQPRRRPFRWLLAAAAVAVVVFLSGTLVRHFENAHGPRATVEVAGSNSLYKVGQTIEAGDVVRSNDAQGVVLALEDGSHVEMRAQSSLALESAADGVRLRLNDGSIIVTAAKQGTGHLYVHTKDALVSVVGTVFLVTAEPSGTRVAVAEGEVHVQQGATLSKLQPGEQVSTNASIALGPVAQAFSWSRSAGTYVALLPPVQRGVDGPRNGDPQLEHAIINSLYRIGDVKVTGVSTSAGEELVKAFVGFKVGDFYNEDHLRQSFENLKRFYALGGDREFVPEPVFDFNVARKTLVLTINIQAMEIANLKPIPLNSIEPFEPAVRVAYDILRGEKATADGRYSDAAEAFRHAYDVNPKSSLVSFRFAEARFQLGDLGTALQMFQNSLKNDVEPKWIEVWAHINIGKIYDVRDQRDRAIPEYQKALKTGDNFHEAQSIARAYLAAPFRQGGALPAPQPSNSNSDSPGKKTFDSACTTCHNAAAAGSAHYATRGEYENLVSGQRAIGASIPDADVPALVDYLFSSFGKKPEPPTTPAPPPSDIPLQRSPLEFR